MNKKGCAKVPKVLDYGCLTLNNFKHRSQEIMAFYVMPQYEKSLLDYILAETNIPRDFYLNLIIQLIDCIKEVHSTGRTYNDVKPENIMMNGNDVFLVDFGFCDKFIDADGFHIEQDTISD